jgi:hypothetical protein
MPVNDSLFTDVGQTFDNLTEEPPEAVFVEVQVGGVNGSPESASFAVFHLDVHELEVGSGWLCRITDVIALQEPHDGVDAAIQLIKHFEDVTNTTRSDELQRLELVLQSRQEVSADRTEHGRLTLVPDGKVNRILIVFVALRTVRSLPERNLEKVMREEVVNEKSIPFIRTDALRDDMPQDYGHWRRKIRVVALEHGAPLNKTKYSNRLFLIFYLIFKCKLPETASKLRHLAGEHQLFFLTISQEQMDTWPIWVVHLLE